MGTGECVKVIGADRSQRPSNGTWRDLSFLFLWVMMSSQKFLSRIVRLRLSDGLLPETHCHGGGGKWGSWEHDSQQAPRRSWREVVWAALALEA